MDSLNNIPLLDEDDSLLFDDSAPSTADVFSCSPLIPIRSIPLQTESGVADSENRNSSVSDSANKENANWNKPQKLSLDPHQMKRKKKGGGYNLRKSLAWNRAFFTEEGVLNPEELSIISGTASSKSGLDLEVIHEEEYVGTSINLQEIEENLFMHSSDALPLEDRKIGARFSPKPAALAKASTAPVSSAKRKILTVNDSVGSRPKRNACPPRLPVASSSLKRPSTVKAPSKEVKVARTPGPKLDVSASTTTARSRLLNAGFSKRNQNAPPATNPPKHAGLKALSKNPKTIPSNPKVVRADKGSVTRTLATPAGKHLNNSVETHPPARKIQSGTEANKESETSLSRGPSDISEKKQETQLQITKLSGLRMPSPSLGFFSIAKAPSSHSQLQKTSKPCKPAKSNILKLQNLETNSVNEARLKHAPAMRSEIVKGKNCTEELSLFDVKSELSMQVDDKQMTCVEAKYNSVGSKKISKQEYVENILGHVNVTYEEHGELCSSNNASSVEDAGFPRHEKKLFSESHAQGQLEKETGQPDVSLKGYQSVLQKRPSMHHHGGAFDLVKSGGDAQNCSETTGSNLEAVNQQLQGEQLKTTSAVRVGEIMSTRESESHVNSCQKTIPEIKCAAASEPKIAKIEGCQLSVDDQSGFIQTIPVLEQCDHSTQVFELDRLSEDCITVSATVFNTELNNVSQERRPFREDNVQNLLLTSQVCPMLKSDFVFGENEMSTNNHCTISKLQLRDEDSSREASIHYDVPCYLPGNFEQQTSNITYSKVKKMVSEDVSLVLNHGDLLDQSAFSQVSADINSNTKDFTGSEAEKPSSCLQHTLLTRLVRDVDHTNTDIKESHVEDAQMRLLNENLEPYKRNSKHLNAFITSKFPLADNNSMNENCSLSDIQSLGAAVRADPENGNNILHSDSDWLPTNIASSEEINKSMEDVHARSFNENPAPFNCNSKHCLVTNDTDFQRSGAVGAADSDDVNSILLDLNGDMSTHVAPSEEIKKTILFEGALCHIYTSENGASNNHSQVMPENKDGNIRTDDLPIDDAKEGYSNMLPLVEFQLNGKIQKMSENKDGDLDMDDVKDGSSDIFPLVEVQLEDNIQAMTENNGRNLDMDDLQMGNAKEGSSDMFLSVKVQVNDNIHDMFENSDGNVDMDDSKECSSVILPLVEAQLCDNIQKMSENKDGDLDMDDVKDGSSDIFPLVEVQLEDNIQAMTENNGRNLDMDDLQMGNAKEGSSDMFLSVKVQVNDNIHDMFENSDGNVDMDDSKECSSVILPLVEAQLCDNIQKMSENKDGNLDMDYVKDRSSDILPLVEVQLDDNIQAMTENNGRNLDMDDLQTGNAKEGSSDMFLSVKVQVNDNIQDMSENSDGNVDMDDSKECSSVILPLAEVQLSDNIQAISENNDEILDMDNAKEGSSDILPLVEVQLDDNIQAMSENNERNLYMDDAKKDSSYMLPLVEVPLNDNIVDVSENNDGNHDMDDSEECSSDILPLVEVQLIDNIQAISGNNDEKLDMDDANEGSSETLPRVEVQLDDNIQAMYENSERNLYMDDLQVDYAKGSSDTLPLVEVQVSGNMQHVSENNDGNLDMDDSKECSSDILPLVEVQVNDNIISSERITSSAENKDSFADVVAWKPEERCSLSESSNLSASDHLTFNLDEFSDTDMLYQSKGGIYFAEDNRKIIHLHESAAKSKQEVLTGNLPTNAAAFSDEWFTATDSAKQKLNQNPPRGDRRETVACDTELRDDGSSRDASIQHHVHGDVTGNIEQQTSTSTYSKAEEMLCEYKLRNHDDVVDQNELSEVCEDFISNTKDSMGSGAEKPSDHIQHSLLGQFVEEFNQTNREIEESHLTTQVQSFTENLVLYNCNSKQCLAVSDGKFPLADSDNVNENSHDPDLQGPCAIAGVDFQNVDDIHLPLDGNWLSTNTASSEEIKKTNLSEDALKGCDVRTCEYKASNDHIQAMPENEDRYLYADERREHLQTIDAKKASSDILPVVEVQLKDNVVSSESNSFIEESRDSFTDEVAWKPEEHRSSENSSLPASDNLVSNNRVPQVFEISLLNSTTFSEEAGTNIYEKDECPNTDMEHQSKGDINYAEDSNKVIHLQESATKSKREVPTLKPPPNAAPFSEEWLAAIEAAGEEILTMKGGAVQNSPTEKPQHEPGPWSPVKRKNQSIGPFDCTKHNIQPSSS